MRVDKDDMCHETPNGDQKLNGIMFTWIMIVALLITGTIQGCSSYYSVKDRSTGEVYFTTRIEELHEGLRLKDERTSELVVIRNYDVTRMDKGEYLYLMNQSLLKMMNQVTPRSQDETDPDVTIRRRE